ncbi:hypothetical protein LT493_40400 [Streptomyces tricolor]|nr:hypothetical protein [Streptomyces tricolor]
MRRRIAPTAPPHYRDEEPRRVAEGTGAGRRGPGRPPGPAHRRRLAPRRPAPGRSAAHRRLLHPPPPARHRPRPLLRPCTTTAPTRRTRRTALQRTYE